MSTDGEEPLAAYAARLSHDLKNPLSGIRMSLELAREELGEDADATVLDLLARAERNAARIEELLDELTASTRENPGPG